ncbi:hypothetical protein ANN_26664, partial [Periplaneta americana]
MISSRIPGGSICSNGIKKWYEKFQIYMKMLENCLKAQLNEDMSNDYIFQQGGCLAHYHDGSLQHHEAELDFEFAFSSLAVCSSGAHVRKRQIRRLLDIAVRASDHNV